MIITGKVESLSEEKYNPEFGYPLALANNIGEDIGNYIYYKSENGMDYCAEITDKRADELQLIACGWVKRKDCRLKP